MMVNLIKKLFNIRDKMYLRYSIYKGLKIGKDSRVMKQVSFGSEPHLVEIGNEVTISFGVAFITHDGATWVFRDLDDQLTSFGSIKIEDRSFIGARSILLPGVSIGKRSVVAAGAVVACNIPDGEVWGGVPAKRIMSTDQYFENKKIEFYNGDKL